MEQINIDMISAPIKLIRSSRKTLSVQVTADGKIIARAPLQMKEATIEKFLLSKSDWIERHVQKSLENAKQFEELQPFTYEEICKMAEKALRIIPERVKYYASLIGVTYGTISIRNQKTKWGSCSSQGNLNFNSILVMAPPEVIDSVVVHELCHRKHMNHSKDFYAEVYRVFPEYDGWNKWLKENGGLLVRRMVRGLNEK